MKVLTKSMLILFVPLYFAAGCVGVKYCGKEYTETKYVRLYFDKSFVPKDKYEVMGDAYLTAPEGYTCRDIDEKLINKGKAVGADAIIITSVKEVETEEFPEPSMKGSEPDAPCLDSVPAQVDGAPVTYDDFDNAVSHRQVVYEYETKVRAVFLKEKALDLKSEALKRSTEGVKVKDIIESESEENLEKVKTLVKETDKTHAPASVTDKKDAQPPVAAAASKPEADSKEKNDKSNKADNTK